MTPPTREWLIQQLRLLTDYDRVYLAETTLVRWAFHIYGNWAQMEQESLIKAITEWADREAEANSRWPILTSRTAIESLARYLVERGGEV